VIRCIRLDDLHVVAGDGPAHFVRERLDRGCDRDELVPIAAYCAEEELGATTESSVPILAQPRDERPAGAHIADLPLEQPTEPRLHQALARRPEQEQMRDLVRERRLIEQRALHHEAAHAVCGDRNRLAAVERRKRERGTQAQRQRVNARIGRPDAGDVDAQSRRVT
jgi:hypothetical protein